MQCKNIDLSIKTWGKGTFMVPCSRPDFLCDRLKLFGHIGEDLEVQSPTTEGATWGATARVPRYGPALIHLRLRHCLAAALQWPLA